jgi:hypothetical protein
MAGAAPYPTDLEKIKARLGGNLGKYFPDSGAVPGSIELAGVSRRSYSNLYLFRTSRNANGGERGLAVKVFLPASGGQDAARLQYAALTSVWPAFRTSKTMTIPRPLDYFPELSAIVTERVQGRSLQQMFRTVPSLLGQETGMARLAEQAGRWLRKFHDATVLSPGPLDVDNKLESLRANRRLLRGAGFSLELCGKLETVLDSLAKDVRNLDLAVASVHGDFTVDNVLFDGERIIAIDLGGKDRNAIYHDIATFLNSLGLIGLTWPVRRSVIEHSSQRFLAGYFGADDYCGDAIKFLRLSGLASVALEILGRRKDSLLVRWWIRPYLERLFRETIKDING